MRKVIATEKAPAAIGPYSQANVLGNTIYVSGQLGINPETGELREGLEAQVEQALENLTNILLSAGTDMNHVLKTTCFLKNMSDFAKMNEIYAKHFGTPYPSRSAVEVGALPKSGLFEIEVIAYIE